MAVSERTPVADRSNLVHRFAGRVHEVLDEVTAGGLHPATMAVDQTAETVRELIAAADRLHGLAVQLLAHGDRIDLAAENGATSTGTWLAHTTRTPRGQATAMVKLAHRLETSFEATATALLAGTVNTEQAKVIVHAVDALPSWVFAEERLRAEAHLLGLATEHDAKELKVLARHLLHVIDPDAADTELAKQLEREEAAAARKTTFTMFDDGQGTCHGSFKIPSIHGAMLATALNALASPKRPDAIIRETLDDHGHLVQRAAPEVLGEAFTQLLERYPTKKLPRTGGGLATVVITIPLDHLEKALSLATLSTGGTITIGQARRLACHAGLIPQVLGSSSEPLDQGRKVRLHTEPMRVAMINRDKTCTALGCTIPAAWCHAHHKKSWARGGKTSVTNGRMLCPRHHTMIHHPAYEHTDLPDGKVRITTTNRRRQ